MPDNQETAKFMQRLLGAAGCANAYQLQKRLISLGHDHNYLKLKRWIDGETTINAEQMHALQTQLGLIPDRDV